MHTSAQVARGTSTPTHKSFTRLHTTPHSQRTRMWPAIAVPCRVFFIRLRRESFSKEAADMQSVKGAQCLDTGVPLSWPWHCRRLQLQAARFLSQKTPSKSPQEVLSPTHVLRLLHADWLAVDVSSTACMSSLHVEGTPTHWRLLPVVTRPLLPPPVANPILCACARTSSRPHANA
jgi:hypothetical protein